jgi:hypothetical protein
MSDGIREHIVMLLQFHLAERYAAMGKHGVFSRLALNSYNYSIIEKKWKVRKWR